MIKVIISTIVALFLEFTVYSPIEKVCKSIIFNALENSPAPLWFSIILRLIFFVAGFFTIYLILTPLIGDN